MVNKFYAIERTNSDYGSSAPDRLTATSSPQQLLSMYYQTKNQSVSSPTSSKTHICWHMPDLVWSPYNGGFLYHRRCACSNHPVHVTQTTIRTISYFYSQTVPQLKLQLLGIVFQRHYKTQMFKNDKCPADFYCEAYSKRSLVFCSFRTVYQWQHNS